MLVVSGHTISVQSGADSSPVEAAISIELRNPGRMDAKVQNVVLSFQVPEAKNLYPLFKPGFDVPAGGRGGVTTPFYDCRPNLVECRVKVELGDGQTLTQTLQAYEPSEQSERWPIVEYTEAIS
ncbi:hypothetical protein [Knoellia sinensis]|nr:hypothetical protein [Knoellia sinensis]